MGGGGGLVCVSSYGMEGRRGSVEGLVCVAGYAIN